MALLEQAQIIAQTFNEGIDWHCAKVDTATGTHGYRLGIPLLVADHEEVRHLLKRMLAYFIAYFFVAQIAYGPKPLFFQCLRNFFGIF